MISVRIPKKNKEGFNLFTFGNVIESMYLDEYGSILTLSGICILDYSYPNSRRQYVVREYNGDSHYRKCSLMNVDKPLELIGCFTSGRKIDFLRDSLKNIEKMYGKYPYELPSEFWLRILAMAENIIRCRNEDGLCNYRNYCSPRKIKAIAEEYGLKEIKDGKVA